MKLTEEYLRLSKILAETEVEYQKNFDALKKFDDDIIGTGVINNIKESIQNRMQLEKAEGIAYNKRKEAENNYKEYLKQLAKSASK